MLKMDDYCQLVVSVDENCWNDRVRVLEQLLGELMFEQTRFEVQVHPDAKRNRQMQNQLAKTSKTRSNLRGTVRGGSGGKRKRHLHGRSTTHPHLND